jgi:PIN domain nuclease of toxin-antitoxin system
VLWYRENSKELSPVARTTIEDAIREARDVHVSAISVIEVVYLVERKRIPAVALQRLREALADPDVGRFIVPVDALVADALEKISRSVVPSRRDCSSSGCALDHSRPSPPNRRNPNDLVKTTG